LSSGLRKGIEELVGIIESSRRPPAIIFIASTGYGKTMASPIILRKAIENGLASGLIHVVSLRALVRKIYEEKFRDTGFHVGYQSHDYIDGVKSPFFLLQLVVSTLDSYFYNIFRTPVAELKKVITGVSRGHYYPALLSIYSSVNVFDEAHMYLGDIDEGISVEMVEAIIKHHLEARTPVIIETATMSTKILTQMFRRREGIKVVYVTYGNDGYNPQLNNLRKGFGEENVVTVHDDDFCDKMRQIKWKTSILDEHEALRRAEEECPSRIVLIVRNTVGKAVSTFEKIKCEDKVLIHGLLHSRDREKAIKAIEEIRGKGRGVIVSTQVIEAGVETDASMLVTDPAPIENLAQRAGRLCREKNEKVFEECISSKVGGEVIVLKPPINIKDSGKFDVYSAERVSRTLEWLQQNQNVEWRLLDDVEGRRSFVHLLEDSEYKHAGENISSSTTDMFLKGLAEAALRNDTGPEALETIQRLFKIPGLRNTISFNVAIKEDNNRYVHIHEIPQLSIDIHRLGKLLSRGCIEVQDNKIILLAVTRDGEIWTTKEIASKLELGKLMKIPKNNYYNVYKILIDLRPASDDQEAFDYFIKIKKECYEEGKGLIV